MEAEFSSPVHLDTLGHHDGNNTMKLEHPPIRPTPFRSTLRETVAPATIHSLFLADLNTRRTIYLALIKRVRDSLVVFRCSIASIAIAIAQRKSRALETNTNASSFSFTMQSVKDRTQHDEIGAMDS
mgnify:CR=1 FL=1